MQIFKLLTLLLKCQVAGGFQFDRKIAFTWVGAGSTAAIFPEWAKIFISPNVLKPDVQRVLENCL